MASFSIAVPLPKQLSMELTMSLLLKNTIDLLFFLKRKLYGFPQSDYTIKKIDFKKYQKNNKKEIAGAALRTQNDAERGLFFKKKK